MAQTVNLFLEKVVASESNFSNFIDIYNQNLDKIDALGNIRLSDIFVDGGFSLGSNIISECLAMQFAQSSIEPNFNNSIYFNDGELNVRDGSGRVIKVTSSGDLGATGSLRGEKITESPILGTSGLSGNFANFTDSISSGLTDKYTLASNGFDVTKSAFNPSLNDKSIMGYVVDLVVNQNVVDTVVIPFGLLSTSVSAVSAQKVEFLLNVGANSRGVKGVFNREITGKDTFRFAYLSSTMPAQSKVVIYEAQVRGQKGEAGILGGGSQSIYYGIVRFTPRNDANKSNSRNSQVIFGNANSQVLNPSDRQVKQVQSITLGGAYLQFLSPSAEGYYNPFFAVNSDHFTNLFVRNENDLWVNGGTQIIDGETFNIFVRTLPLLQSETLNTFIKDYD